MKINRWHIFLLLLGVAFLLRNQIAAWVYQLPPTATPPAPFDPNMQIDSQYFTSPEYDDYKASGGTLGYLDWAIATGRVQT